MSHPQCLRTGFFLVAVCFLLSGCASAVIGGAATAGIASLQERGLSGAASDFRIQTDINNLWLQHSVDLFSGLDLLVNEGRVLITGSVPEPQLLVEAVRLAWQVAGVREVINEAKVAEASSLGSYADDAWINAQIRAQLLFAGSVSHINYSIETVNRHVYLMGIAQNQAELDRVLDIARTTARVAQVTSHVRVKDPSEE